jgi:uncharacterized repeat protein (TIGR03803 family)
LYGVTGYGGDGTLGGGNGVVFKVNTDGTAYAILHTFTGGSDGGEASGNLLLSSGTLYGVTTSYGYGSGTVFKLNSDGSGFTTLYSFTPRDISVRPGTNGDGAFPYSGLVLSGNTLYGTTYGGGSSGYGTLFAVNTDGTGFRTLHNFTAVVGVDAYGNPINGDGAEPLSQLVLSGNTLYGTASHGGSSGAGTVFKINTDGTGFKVVYGFTGKIDGAELAERHTGLVLSGSTLYGTATGRGGAGNGTVFSISFTPQLNIIPSGPNAILTWPTNYAGFDYSGYILQSTTNLTSPIWTTNLPAPSILNGQNTVTNPISGTQQFFRLSQ